MSAITSLWRGRRDIDRTGCPIASVEEEGLWKEAKKKNNKQKTG